MGRQVPWPLPCAGVDEEPPWAGEEGGCQETANPRWAHTPFPTALGAPRPGFYLCPSRRGWLLISSQGDSFSGSSQFFSLNGCLCFNLIEADCSLPTCVLVAAPLCMGRATLSPWFNEKDPSQGVWASGTRGLSLARLPRRRSLAFCL